MCLWRIYQDKMQFTVNPMLDALGLQLNHISWGTLNIESVLIRKMGSYKL